MRNAGRGDARGWHPGNRARRSVGHRRRGSIRRVGRRRNRFAARDAACARIGTAMCDVARLAQRGQAMRSRARRCGAGEHDERNGKPAMRDIALFAIIFGALPFVLFHPWIGAMLWTWVSLMNPHRLAWGPAFNFPFAAIVAGTTLLGLVLTRDRRSLPMTPPVIMLMVFVVWMCVTSVFAIYPNLIGEMFSRVMKIQL